MTAVPSSPDSIAATDSGPRPPPPPPPTPTGQPSTKPPTPVFETFALAAPIIGGLMLLEGSPTPWVGGMPLADLSGLADPDERPRSTTRFRCAKSSTKDSFYRTKINEDWEKFYPDKDPSRTFEKLLKHATKTGLDTVLYVPDLSIVEFAEATPKTPVVNLLSHHAQVTANHVAKMVAGQMEKADVYWHEQNDEFATILRGLISKELEDLIHSHGLPQMSAADLIMLIVLHCSPSSFEHLEKLKMKVKDACPTKYPNCNVVLYVNDVRTWVKELIGAGSWSNILLLYICRAFCRVTVPLFSQRFTDDHHKINALLKRVGQESTAYADRVFAEADYDPLIYLKKGEDIFRDLKDDWGPLQTPTDSGAAREANLAAAGGGPAPKADQRKCFNCNQTGHIAANCPKKKTKPSTEAKTKTKPTDGKSKWREVAPAANEKHVKIHKDHIFFWCKECKGGKGFWTQSHRKHGTGNNLSKSALKDLKKEFERTGNLPEANLAVVPEYDCDSDGVAFD